MPIEPDDICFNKAATLERAIRRMKEEYSLDPEWKSFTHLDAFILNAERACQAAIDMAMHIVAVQRLGIPQNSGEAFQILEKNEIISGETARSMAAMTGFRNVAIHEYQSLSLEVIDYIARAGWKSFEKFCTDLGLRIEP